MKQIIKHVWMEKFNLLMLSKDGIELKNNYKISFFSDFDIVCLMKQFINDVCIKEYFARNERKHPIWKSHCEFYHFLDCQEDNAKLVADYLAPLSTYLAEIETLYETKIINKELKRKIQGEDLTDKEAIIKIIDVLLNYKDDDEKDELEYCLMEAKSNFHLVLNSKLIYIRFDDGNRYSSYNKLVGERKENSVHQYKFFYLYCNKKINSEKFLQYLLTKAKSSIDIQV